MIKTEQIEFNIKRNSELIKYLIDKSNKLDQEKQILLQELLRIDGENRALNKLLEESKEFDKEK